MDLWRPLAAQGSDLLLMGACTVNYILCPPPPAQWRNILRVSEPLPIRDHKNSRIVNRSRRTSNPRGDLSNTFAVTDFTSSFPSGKVTSWMPATTVETATDVEREPDAATATGKSAVTLNYEDVSPRSMTCLQRSAKRDGEADVQHGQEDVDHPIERMDRSARRALPDTADDLFPGRGARSLGARVRSLPSTHWRSRGPMLP